MLTKHLIAILALILLAPAIARVQQKDSYDYWRFQRDMIQRGQQAIMMCNGLFTSNRTLEQVFAQELRFMQSSRSAPRADGDYDVDRNRRTVCRREGRRGTDHALCVS